MRCSCALKILHTEARHGARAPLVASALRGNHSEESPRPVTRQRHKRRGALDRVSVTPLHELTSSRAHELLIRTVLCVVCSCTDTAHRRVCSVSKNNAKSQNRKIMQISIYAGPHHRITLARCLYFVLFTLARSRAGSTLCEFCVLIPTPNALPSLPFGTAGMHVTIWAAQATTRHPPRSQRPWTSCQVVPF